ncbi:lactonase family protein [Luteolibacter pohnpeiensis]|uniref:Lactonase family protein n=1 Tax=Luteolibacter pohnpeiensis TaxID=454153 RepID=A0A934S813_9BACT|nr:lactonase family protein [Luteolibacter pohnpeiensis]MBK1881064.1 lactonase family protein [Luteolibacter pohnpeiensis]
MMRKTSCWIACLLFTCGIQPWSTAKADTLFIGTDSGGGKSKGIYHLEFDSGSGQLGEPELAATYTNPGFLVQNPVKPILYCCGVPKGDFGKGVGSVAAFRILENRKLEFIKEISSGGINACHVAVDRLGRTVAVANYSDGSFSTIRLDQEGIPEKLVSTIGHDAKGPNANRQDRAHAHGVYFTKDNRHLWMPDLGLDRVFVCDFNPETSAVVENPEMDLRLSPGDGPRHLAFSKDEKNVYVINELANRVSVFTKNPDSGKYDAIQSINTLPESYRGSNTTAEIEIHPNGKFVYGSNRGDDSIALFQRDEQTGKLEWVKTFACGGKTPRHFKIDPSGKWLICAHQDSDSIEVRSIDPKTGFLGDIASSVTCPKPICVLFAR